MNPEADNNLEEWEARLAEYALGVMQPGAASEFERQLNECRVHLTLAQQYTEVIAALAYAAPPAEPPSEHKARFMSRLSNTPQGTQADDATGDVSIVTLDRVVVPSDESTRPAAMATPYVSDGNKYRERKRARIGMPAIAAIAAALVLLIGGTAYLTSQLMPTRTVLPQFIAFPFEGQGPQVSASAYCVINRKTREVVLMTNNLQPLGPQQVYELWWVRSTGERIAAGTFSVDETGKAEHKAKLPDPLSGLEGAAVTVEQAPGGTEPTGDIVLAGDYRVP